MMTIKEFAKLLNCNTQTLRYYDKINLLKPVKVDKFSSYRYYEKEQALRFIKIKNLQAADFSIEEIKNLLDKSDCEIYKAFNQKIATQEEKLQRIIHIRDTYLEEKSAMEKIVENMKNLFISNIKDFEMLSEFGLKPEDGDKIVNLVSDYFQKSVEKTTKNDNIYLKVDDELIEDKEEIAKKLESLKGEALPQNLNLTDSVEDEEEDDISEDNYELIYEVKDFEHVYDFIDDIPRLEANAEYRMDFRLKEEFKRGDLSFPLFMLGAVIHKQKEYSADECILSCNVEGGKSEKMFSSF